MEKNHSGDNTDGAILLVAIVVLGLFFVSSTIFGYYFQFWYITKQYFFYALSLIPKDISHYLFLYADIPHYLSTFIDNIHIKKYDIGNSIIIVNEYFGNKTIEDIQENQSFITYVDRVYTLVISPFIIYIVYLLTKKINNKKRFDTVYNIKSLAEQESEIWTQIKPIVYEQDKMTSSKSLDSGWFAMSEKPQEYFKRNNLLNYTKNTDKSSSDFKMLNFTLNYNKAYQYFSNELGAPFKDFNSLSIEKKCVLAIIVAKLTSQPEKSKYFNDSLATAYSSHKDKEHEKINLKYRQIIHKEVEDYISSSFGLIKTKRHFFFFKKTVIDKRIEIVNELVSKHFYEKTLIARLLEASRKKGVLATCEFLWLKKENRDLWYMLSQTGRIASFCECAGSWSHYLYEKTTDQKIRQPKVKAAIDSADHHLKKLYKNYKGIEK
jgi:hypothetical protein